mmetsp:Transcript_17083/g.48547  ORF Transcript_17083/g.48547 Transcript_17083/m.48547 type:complete len:136 (+) Transcript_17083:53-460(+)
MTAAAIRSSAADLIAAAVTPNDQLDYSITEDMVVRAVSKARGAPGPDQWTSKELRQLPRAAVCRFAAILRGWLSRGCTPTMLRDARQFGMPKAGKIQEGVLDAGAIRPLCVFSFGGGLLRPQFYRLCNLGGTPMN